MKEITLKFREVAVDGNPKTSGEYAVIQHFFYNEKPNELMFSSVYGLWNASDNTTREQAETTAIGTSGTPCRGEVTHWIPILEFSQMLKEDAQDVQAMD